MNELVKIESTQLESVVKESGLAIQEGEEIKQSYLPFIIALSEIQENAGKINFDNPQPIDETIARELRLKTVKIRTGASDLKDSRKRTFLLKGNLEQAAYNLIAASCKLTEETFVNVEKAREIAENKRKAERRNQRVEILTPLGFDYSYTDLSNMPDEQFDSLVSVIKKDIEEKKQAELKAENERIEKEKAEKTFLSRKLELLNMGAKEDEGKIILICKENEDFSNIIYVNDLIALTDDKYENYKSEFMATVKVNKEYDEAQRLENIRLKKEAKERERLAEIERKKQSDLLAAEKAKAEKERKEAEEKAAKLKAENDDKLEAERKERERLANELKAKQDKEAAELKAKQEAENKAKSAPDKEKALVYAKQIESIALPEIDSEEIYSLILKADEYLKKLAAGLRKNLERF
jgi:hypothetical protein